MAQLNIVTAEKDLPVELFARALVTLMVQQLNQLRAFHGLAALTRTQVIDAIKNEIKSMERT